MSEEDLIRIIANAIVRERQHIAKLLRQVEKRAGSRHAVAAVLRLLDSPVSTPKEIKNENT